MNFALSAGLSAYARAPETISALTAAEIIKVLSICSPHVEFVLPRKGSVPCAITTRQHRRAFRALEPDLTHAEQRRAAATVRDATAGTDHGAQTTIARTEQALTILTVEALQASSTIP
jgi:hypothetical protein